MATGTAIESSAFSLWGGKQSAKGTPVATADKMLRQVDGGIGINRAFGNENYGDGLRFSNAVDFTDTLMGSGDPVIQGQPGPAGWLAAQSLGTDTVGAPVSAVYPHTITPSNSGGRWLTVWKKVGVAIGPVRHKFNDTRIAQLVIAASQGNKTLHLTPSMLSIDPGEIFTTDPVKVDDGEDPFIWTEGTGTFNLDGGGAGAIGEVQDLQVTINDNLDAWYGDDVKPALVVPGRGVITVAFTLALTDLTLPTFNKVHYGVTGPTGGTKPVKTIYSGSIVWKATRGAAGTLRDFQITVPKINYSPDLSVEGLAGGGVVELGMAGEARSSGSPMITVLSDTLDVTAY